MSSKSHLLYLCVRCSLCVCRCCILCLSLSFPTRLTRILSVHLAVFRPPALSLKDTPEPKLERARRELVTRETDGGDCSHHLVAPLPFVGVFALEAKRLREAVACARKSHFKSGLARISAALSQSRWGSFKAEPSRCLVSRCPSWVRFVFCVLLFFCSSWAGFLLTCVLRACSSLCCEPAVYPLRSFSLLLSLAHSLSVDRCVYFFHCRPRTDTVQCFFAGRRIDEGAFSVLRRGKKTERKRKKK